MTDFVLQLHITGNCNLRCKHCYIDDHCAQLRFSDIKQIVRQFEELIEELERSSGQKIRAHINFTGGEPFLHPEISEILKLFITKNDRFYYGVMSNGTLLNVKNLVLLKKLHLGAFQVSLDGDESTHDSIRGKGNYKRVLKALDILHLWHISTRVSFTANKGNYRQFSAVAKACREHNVRTLWSDRYIPFEHNSNIQPLTAVEMEEYVQMLQKERENPENKKVKLYIQNYRALQFLVSCDIPYFCKAGDAMITVDEFGNILPCRRMPIVCGNIEHTTLSEVYFTNSVFKKMRQHKTPKECMSCEYQRSCKGGSRCMAFAVKGSCEEKDPCCYLNL